MRLQSRRRPTVRMEISRQALAGETFVCASAGNHGLSMAAGARLFGARAVVYVAETVPTAFADRLRDKGADVVVDGDNYEESMAAAMAAAEREGWRLLSDSSWAGYIDPARDVMEGYLVMASEAGDQIKVPPTHIFLQAGVGGLAAACAVMARRLWGDDPTICVVEPEFASALKSSLEAGKIASAPGPVSVMGRLDCKEPSLLALDLLAREADAFLTISESDAAEAVSRLALHGVNTSPSGVAGLAGLITVMETLEHKNQLLLTEQSRVLIYISEEDVGD